MNRLTTCWSALLGCALSASILQACPIPVTNAGFETDPITGGNAPAFQIRTSAPTGWTFDGLPVSPVAHGLLGPHKLRSTGQPNGFYGDNPPGTLATGFEGNQVFFTIDGRNLIKQTLGSTLQANTTYTVSAATGTRTNWNVFGGYHIELKTATTGKTVLRWTAGGRNLARLGHFSTTERTFTTGANPPGLGEPLQIVIGQPAADRDFVPSPPGPAPSPNLGYTELDNIKVSAVPAPNRPVGTPIDVIIVAGQSNAHGWGSTRSALSPDRRHYVLEPARKALLIYNQRNITDIVTSTGSLGQLSAQGSGFEGNAEGFGPELSFATEIARYYDKPTVIIKYTMGSAGLIYSFRKTPTAVHTNLNYRIYAKMMEFINSAKQQLVDQGYTPTIKGFFWLQGEGEVLDTNPAVSASYASNLGQFLADIRADLSLPNLKFYLTQINPNTPKFKLTSPHDFVLHTDNVNNALSAAGPNTVYVLTEGISSGFFPDQVHYNGNGLIDVGLRWADAYIANNP